ncbi:MAG: hypothetical protein RR141_04200 [Rikenellaceae bacterium]
MIKRYISLNSLQLLTTVTINDRQMSIAFKGGQSKPYRIHGSLITDDPILQKAIETDGGYGKSFIIYDIDDQTTIEKPIKIISQKRKEATMIEGIHSAQMAIEWIRRNLSVELDYNLTCRKIKKFALSQGYDFPDLTE